MTIKINDSIKSCNNYQDKLFHPRKTIKNGLIALRKIKPSIFVKFKRLDYLDRVNIPVYICKINKETKGSHPISWIFKHEAYGKGKSLIQSKASALMELLERFTCDTFFRDNNNFLLTISDRVKSKAILEIFPLFLAKRYRNDAFILRELEKMPFRWVRSFSLTQNKTILLPLDWSAFTTNGFASGNCIEEAILQGLCEVIERHFIVTVVENKIITPSIDINSIDNNEAKKIISKFNYAGIKLFIKDFSCGFGIPTIGILAYDSKGQKIIKIYCAAGTSLNKDIAIIRALTEVAQHRAQILFTKAPRSHTVCFPFYKNLKEADSLIDSKRTINFSDLPTFSDKNLKAEIETAVIMLKNKGLEVIVTDVTHPIIKIPTVIVTILGARITDDAHRDPYIEIQEYYSKLNNYNKSIGILKTFFKFYSFEKKNKDLLSIYGLKFEKLRKFKQAIKIYLKIISLCGNDDIVMLVKTYKALMRCYANLGNNSELDAILQKLRQCYVKFIKG